MATKHEHLLAVGVHKNLNTTERKLIVKRLMTIVFVEVHEPTFSSNLSTK